MHVFILYIYIWVPISDWCDTEDWSNGCWKFKTQTIILNSNFISQYYSFYCIFNQINSALVSIRDIWKPLKF